MLQRPSPGAFRRTVHWEQHPTAPPRAVMVALRALAADTQRNSVYLVSGQDRATVASHFESIPRLGLVTDSGYSFRNAGEEDIHSWETMDEHFDLSWVETVTEIMKIYMLRTVGTYMERKKFAVLWRFADADPDYGALQVRPCVRCSSLFFPPSKLFRSLLLPGFALLHFSWW